VDNLLSAMRDNSQTANNGGSVQWHDKCFDQNSGRFIKQWVAYYHPNRIGHNQLIHNSNITRRQLELLP
jgi:hypothetical protein